MSSTPKGMVAHRTKDPRNSSVTLVEYVKAPAGKYADNIRICTNCNKPFTDRSAAADNQLCSTCRELKRKAEYEARRREEASRIQRTCVTCGKPFYIKAAKAKELRDAGLELFTHCYACQMKKVAEANK